MELFPVLNIILFYTTPPLFFSVYSLLLYSLFYCQTSVTFKKQQFSLILNRKKMTPNLFNNFTAPPLSAPPPTHSWIHLLHFTFLFSFISSTFVSFYLFSSFAFGSKNESQKLLNFFLGSKILHHLSAPPPLPLRPLFLI